MTTSIVIPVHNRAGLTEQCLDGVFETVRGEVEVIVVDDGSTDGTAELLAGYGNSLRVVAHEQATGFATACNDGAAAASGDWLVFLNNDTIPEAGWLEALLRQAGRSERPGLIGAKLLFADRTVQHAGVVFSRDGAPRHIYTGFPESHPAVNKSREFQAVTGACALIRRSTFEEVGPFDTAYLNGFEDVDLCQRLRRAGYSVEYCHESVLVHLESVTRNHERDEHNFALFQDRWSDFVHADDVAYYVEDGLMRLTYWEQYPLLLSVSPLLAVLTEERSSDLEDVLEQRSRQVFETLKESTTLRVRLREAEAFGDELIRDAARDRPAASLDGVNVAGYFKGELGVGEVARRVVAGLDAAGIPYSTATYENLPSRQEHPFVERETAEPYATNLVCVNADHLPTFARDAGPGFFRGRHTIGFWWWETSVFPSRYQRAFELVREIWVGSSHVAAAISPHTPSPVRVFPVPVAVPPVRPLRREQLGLPDGFMFLFSFDFFAVFVRKNPLGLVDAFTRAFAPGEGPVLVIKSVNGQSDPRGFAQLTSAADARPDVYVIDGYLPAEEKDALTASCDCYVSLHRSEGFGLTLADALAYGRPTIATGYSGNLDFMTGENSYLVPYSLTEIPPGAGPYTEGEWAEPDLDAAAELMRRVYEQPDEARAKAELARREMAAARPVARAGAFVATRLAELRAGAPV